MDLRADRARRPRRLTSRYGQQRSRPSTTCVCSSIRPAAKWFRVPMSSLWPPVTPSPCPWAKLQSPPRPPRRPDVRHPERHPGRPPSPFQQREHAPRGPPEDRPGRRGPRRPLGRPHHRHRPLHLLHRPPLPEPGPDDERVLRQRAQAHLPRRRHRQHDRARQAHPERVRQQVLRRPREPRGAVHLGPGPALRPEDRAVRQEVRAGPAALLREVRGVDGEDGGGGRADGQQRRDQGQLLGAKRRREVRLVRGGGG
ncbi:peroxidase 12-like [Iris pallida]|uniref:Peroxidase 12-like n=1 Tax=Iris pallida TaxID=29817 RepID=A0AAX6GBD2_IRIPA|nr:peroxidase 12-like [Iris pallida]